MATRTQIAELYVATFNRAADADGLAYWDGSADVHTDLTNLNDIAAAMLESPEASALYTGMDRATKVNEMYQNLFGRVAEADGLAYWSTGDGSTVPESEMIIALIKGALADDARTIQNKGIVGLNYADSGLNGDFSLSAVTASNESMITPNDQIAQLAAEQLASEAHLAINGTTVAQGDSVLDVGEMRVTGTQDIRVDLTNKEDQLQGVDLDNSGAIDTDGVENNSPISVSGITVMDAYARNPLNTTDSDNNFLGDINFDGTGYSGDGVSTDGNIYLGGLGDDVAFGGIGNDFMTGGQSGGDVLEGGRNADFFFVEMSELDPVNGDKLSIDGGSTYDNDPSQDTDWLLLEASDDDEPVTVKLNNNAPNGALEVTARSGDGFSMDEVENINASGNLYGFVNGIDVALGDKGQTIAGENMGIGSTAQLIINDVTGNGQDNIIIGGYDNDTINAGAGNDIIFGGDMQFNQTYHNNPNILDITNDGRDTINAGAGDDAVMFEQDGGSIDGGDGSDTLFLTDYTGGLKDTDLSSDGVVRIDLKSALPNSAGYGGADVDGTADQTNYADDTNRVTVTNMESVIATGMGAIDYDIDGANNGNLDSTVQNYKGIDANLDLRGTDGANTLYANGGDDVIEGRGGNDMLSGGDGNDDFIFSLSGEGDGLDTIHRQTDIGNNITDGTFGRDFGLGSTENPDHSYLYIDISASDIAAANKELDHFTIDVAGVTYEISSGTALDNLEAATNAADVATVLTDLFDADPAINVTSDGDIITIEDTTGRAFTNFDVQGTVIGGGASFTNPTVSTETINGAVSEDRLLFVSYQDRADNERVDDDAVFGGDSLGNVNYAQDLIVGFNQGGDTVVAEGQSFQVDLKNLAVQDEVTVSVNGVQYSLTVGEALDGSLIPNETTAQFTERLANYIDGFMDDDTAAGSVQATNNTPSSSVNTGVMTLSQNNYHGEETVFMNVGVDVTDNSSLGEAPTATVTNNTATEITLTDFDARNNALNADNVLFLGDSGISRSVLETAKNDGGDLLGSDAIVVNVNDNIAVNSSAAEGVNGAKIFFNAQENLTTGNINDYAIHGDDQLFGGTGNDNIQAGTGDDRVYGSFGTDTIDGGKELYNVDGVVRVLNDYEKAQVDALPSTIAINTIDDTFDDTLIYQQSDFGVVGAGGSKFEISLDLSANQANGGAGKVVVDGSSANTTLFTNMENIRTVSGDGTLLGQGDDTLNLSVSVNPLTGAETANGADMTYDLTSASTAGNVKLDGNLISKVDGVENVLFGSGDDILSIDETEADKNNTVDGGLGDDTVEYSFDISGNNTFNPAVTLTVNSASDTVSMTGGFVGLDVPVDTLTSVETINFTDTLDNPTLDDTLDVTNVSDSVVDFVNGEVRDGSGNVQVKIGNMQDFEIVNADYSDTVIVADNMNNTNVSSDDHKLAFDSFLNYDLTYNNHRETIADMRTNNEVNNSIPQAENIGLYTFNMGPDSDTVDYSNEAGTVAAVADFTSPTKINVNNVLVSDDNDIDFTDGSNRVDAITGVENLVASKGNSIIDLTSATGGLKVRFNADNGPTQNVASLDRDVYRVQLSDLNTTSPVEGMNFLSYEDAGDSATINQATADWNTIEGSDNDIMVELTDHETNADNTFNLRGGHNEVNYNELTRSIDTSISLDGSADVITVTNTFTDGNGKTIGGTDTITNNSAQNAVSAGTLRIEASQDAEDSFTLTGNDSKAFLLGEVVDGSDQITVTFGDTANSNSMVLTGYEFITDAATDDTYTMSDMDRVLNQLTFRDNAAIDRDTIVVGNDAVAFNGGNAAYTAPASTISLEVINDAYGMDFDVLDMTKVTTAGLTVLGDDNDQDGDATLNAADADFVNPDGTVGAAAANRDISADTVVLGDLSLVDDVQLIDTLAVTDASGTTFDLDMTAGELQDASNATLFTFDSDVDTLDASRTTTGVTMTVTGAGNVAVVGGTGDDRITGGTGNNTITGGLGADALDGNFTPAVAEVQIITIGDGVLDGDDVLKITTAGANTLTIGSANADAGTDIILANDSSDEDQVGAGLAAYSIADWNTQLNTAANGTASIESVSYDAASNELSITYAATGQATDISSAIVDGSSGDGKSATITTVDSINGAGNSVDYAAQVDTADTFTYATAADSTATSMDSIYNFDTLDKIDLTAVNTTLGGVLTSLVDKGDALDFNNLTASSFFSTADIAVGSDGTNARVFVDINQDGNLDAGDMQIELVGQANADNIDNISSDFIV